MEFETLKYELSENILTITLNRPDRMNAFTKKMSQEIVQAFADANEDDEVKAIVVTGEGKAFCAGADLGGGEKTFNMGGGSKAKNLEDDIDRIRDTGGLCTLAIFESKKPVIGAINGAAVGIGATMTLAMDIRLASEKAKYGFVFARRGITPEAASAWFLPRIVGISQALEWCMRGDVFGAEEAKEGGLVKDVYPADQLLDEAYKLARVIVDNCAPVSIALTRQMMWRMLGADHPMEAHKIDSRAIYYRGKQSDAKEGVMSFLEKRPAEFKDKPSSDMPEFYPWWDEKTFS